MWSKYSMARLLADLICNCFKRVLARSGACVREAVDSRMGSGHLFAAERIAGMSG